MDDVRCHISLLAWEARPALEWSIGLMAAAMILVFGRGLRLFSRRWDWMTDETGRGE